MGHNTNHHNVGKTIATLRKDKGWTQLDLAEKLHVSDKAVSKWESGESSPSLGFFPILAKLFDVSIDYLMVGKLDASEIENVQQEELGEETDEQAFENLPLTEDGLLDIGKIFEIKNYCFVKKALRNYPVHIFEVLYKDFKEQNWRHLFEYSFDRHISINGLLEGNVGEIEKSLLDYWNKTNSMPPVSTLDEAEKVIRDKVDRLLEEFKWELDKERTIADLTEEYFREQLKKGNTEFVIIKLCVRLEAVLKSDYHSECDFSEMLNKYCDTIDEKTARILQKLRIQRNGIVHSEPCQEKLSMDEIKSCIEYICKLG